VEQIVLQLRRATPSLRFSNHFGFPLLKRRCLRKNSHVKDRDKNKQKNITQEEESQCEEKGL
jgi:hypothetical protein